MHIDKQPIPDLSVPPNDFAALRSALDAQNTPPAVERELMAAFAVHFPPRRWYHAFSPRQWGIGVGSSALAALMALILTMQAPAPIKAVEQTSISSVDEGNPFIALESIERIEQEVDPQLLEADLPRTVLASLGLPVSPEMAGDSVRAEMLVGADGSPLALRLVSLP